MAVPGRLPAKITVQHRVLQARIERGLQEKRLHDVRHTAASEMVNAGADLYTVGGVLGHKDPRSTQRYSHLATGTLKVAVDKIGRKRVA